MLATAQQAHALAIKLGTDATELGEVYTKLHQAQAYHAATESLAELPDLQLPQLGDTGWLAANLATFATTKAVADMKIPVAPAITITLQDTQALEGLCHGLAQTQGPASVVLPVFSGKLPALADSETLDSLYTGLKVHSTIIQLSLPASPALPRIQDTAAAAVLEQALTAAAKVVEEERAALAVAQLEGADAEQAYQQLVSQLGGLCPICHNTLKDHAHAN
jgi:hypothetical protein